MTGQRSFHHERLDFDAWARRICPQAFKPAQSSMRPTNTQGMPDAVWRPYGNAICGPADLCEIEITRRELARTQDMGRCVPSDIFVWRMGEPAKPYLTKIGGTPWRPAGRPWPTIKDGRKLTFVAQICFLDSIDLLPRALPGDVMLIFMAGPNDWFGGGPPEVQIEWSDATHENPISPDACPPPQWIVPQLTGVLHESTEFPDATEVFEQAGVASACYFATTQSTKIGTETFFCQDDPRAPGQSLFCELSSIIPWKRWPFVDLESLPEDKGEDAEHWGWGRYHMCLADLGCMYFLIDEAGRITWSGDC